MTLAIIGLVYLVLLAPLALVLIRCLSRFRSAAGSREIFEGIAASCLVSVCAGLILTKGIGVQPGILAWLLFVVICGILIWLPEPPLFRDAIVCAVAPALCLLGTLLAVYFIPMWLTDAAGAVMSTSPSATPVPPSRALSFTLFGAIAAIPAIAVAIIARSRVIAVAKSAYQADPKQLGRVEKVINTLIRIGTSLAAVFVVAR